MCWFAVLWERALSFRRPLAQHSFGGWLCPQWGVSRAEVATLCRVVSCDLHLPERHSCWRVCNSGDGAVPGSPIAGSTCLGSEAVALCGTIFVLCSSCASGTSSALAGDRLFLCRRHLGHVTTQSPASVSGRWSCRWSCTVGLRAHGSGGSALGMRCQHRAYWVVREAGQLVQIAGSTRFAEYGVHDSGGMMRDDRVWRCCMLG